jgi:alkaline phosphatase D
LDDFMRPVVGPLLLAITLLPRPAVTQTAAAAREPLTRIAFGSGNQEDQPQPLWELIGRQRPQLWIWLGDNIYADTDKMQVMRAKYVQQLSNPSYRKFVSQVPVIGTWNDHDYGKNNGGREYVARTASQQAFLDFFRESPNSARRKQAGVYASYTYGPAGKQVKVILLDVRYNRDPIDSNGSILGKTQWNWLERELRSSNAQIHIIVSGIQVVAQDHRFEKWGDFPAERIRLQQLIADTETKGIIFLSGDRHIAELSRLDKNPAGYPLYDLTTSGLTHFSNAAGETNRHRVSELVSALNYGTIDIDWNQEDPTITMRVRDDKDAVRIDHTIRLSELQ